MSKSKPQNEESSESASQYPMAGERIILTKLFTKDGEDQKTYEGPLMDDASVGNTIAVYLGNSRSFTTREIRKVYSVGKGKFYAETSDPDSDVDISTYEVKIIPKDAGGTK